jgi:hypothetical protein
MFLISSCLLYTNGDIIKINAQTADRDKTKFYAGNIKGCKFTKRMVIINSFLLY